MLLQDATKHIKVVLDTYLLPTNRFIYRQGLL